MDPTAAYLEMFAAMNERDFETARERALGLREWLGRGGFYPPRYSKVEVDAYLARVLRRTAHVGRKAPPPSAGA